jgi:hypothetical protein
VSETPIRQRSVRPTDIRGTTLFPDASSGSFWKKLSRRVADTQRVSETPIRQRSVRPTDIRGTTLFPDASSGSFWKKLSHTMCASYFGELLCELLCELPLEQIDIAPFCSFPVDSRAAAISGSAAWLWLGRRSALEASSNNAAQHSPLIQSIETQAWTPLRYHL